MLVASLNAMTWQLRNLSCVGVGLGAAAARAAIAAAQARTRHDHSNADVDGWLSAGWKAGAGRLDGLTSELLHTALALLSGPPLQAGNVTAVTAGGIQLTWDVGPNERPSVLV